MPASADYDGTNDYIYYDNGSDIASAYPLFISGWVYLESSTDQQTFFQLGESGTDDGMVVKTESGVISYQIDNGPGTDVTCNASASTTYMNAWNHFLGVSRSSTDHEFYVNGTSAATDTFSMTAASWGRDRISIGAETIGTGSTNGKIAYVMVGADSVDDAMAKEIYNNAAFMPPNVIAYYPQWEAGAAATDYKDIGPNGYHMAGGTIPGQATIGPPVNFKKPSGVV